MLTMSDWNQYAREARAAGVTPMSFFQFLQQSDPDKYAIPALSLDQEELQSLVEPSAPGAGQVLVFKRPDSKLVRLAMPSRSRLARAR